MLSPPVMNSWVTGRSASLRASKAPPEARSARRLRRLVSGSTSPMGIRLSQRPETRPNGVRWGVSVVPAPTSQAKPKPEEGASVLSK